MGVISGTIAAVATVAGVAGNLINQRKAQKEQKRANAVARRQENVRALRERQQAIRAQRIANASALTAGTNAGVQGSSMMQGAMASFNSQTAANMNFTDQMNSLTLQRMQAIASAENYMNRGAMLQQAGQMIGMMGPKKTN